MKKEMLRINNLNMEYSSVENLMNISICLLGGECVGFLGLENSGKNLLVDFICGKHNIDQASFYFDGIRHINTDDLRKNVYKITVSNYLIDDWTVAEYIFLVDGDSSFFSMMNRKKLVNKTDELFREFDLDMNAEKKLKKLSELEKRMVDLLKAYSKKAKIIMIEDEFEGCSTQDIEKFKFLLNRVVKNNIVSVINSHSDNVSYILSDKYVIFKNGYIVKKCHKDYFSNNSHLENLLLGLSAEAPKDIIENDKVEQCTAREIVYSVRNLILKKKKIFHLDFYKSEVVTILALDVKEKTLLFELLSGRYIDKSMCVVLNHQSCDFNDIIDFVKCRIASIADMGGESELLLSMSAGNNLLMPSLEKISAIQHVLMERKVVKMLENEVKSNIKVQNENVKDMSVNDYITLLMERWYIYKPKVLILFEPFVHCDIYGVSLVKSYIKKYIEIGTTVIIIKSREEYVEDISDRIIQI